MSSTSNCNPKREILLEAIKELRLANTLLKKKNDVDTQYAKQHIDMALKLINGVIGCLEPPEQTFNLD